MEYPKRSSSHIKETASWKIFSSKVPDEWIIREVTERDYGIDSYVEIVSPNGDVRGDLCSVQLKSSSSINWTTLPDSENKIAKFAGLKKSTVNYWMGLPIPVFLIWAVVDCGKAFFSPIKEQTRKKYSKYLDPNIKTFSFDFIDEYELGSDIGNLIFIAQYLKEKEFNNLEHYLRGLFIHQEQYYDFILSNQGRDPFLEVEYDRQLMLIHIYKLCFFLADYFRIEWKVADINEVYKEDKKVWKHNSYFLLHELSLDKILKGLEPVFKNIVKQASKYISEIYGDYWIVEDWPLFTMCSNINTGLLSS